MSGITSPSAELYEKIRIFLKFYQDWVLKTFLITILITKNMYQMSQNYNTKKISSKVKDPFSPSASPPLYKKKYFSNFALKNGIISIFFKIFV